MLEVIKRKLIKKKYKISVAESCTGGLLSSSLTKLSGSSKFFDVGLITYSNFAKRKLLKVPDRILTKHGAVSYQSCVSMVEGLQKFNKKNLCVSITGIAGPNGGSKKKPVGLVFVGLKKGKIIKIFKFKFKNLSKIYIQRMTVKKTLSLILKFIEK